MSKQRFAIVILIVLCILALIAASLFLPVKPFQVEVIDVGLGAMLGILASAATFYFKG